MGGLTTELLGRACRTFLTLAYPEGPATIPANRRRFWTIDRDDAVEALLGAGGLSERLPAADGSTRGYTLRLGSARFPHIKLQVLLPGPAPECVFAVDTHDVLRCTVSAAEAEAWQRLQADNRLLKQRIEQELEKDGLLTFNALLRRGLVQ
jgi:hypothetical protein